MCFFVSPSAVKVQSLPGVRVDKVSFAFWEPLVQDHLWECKKKNIKKNKKDMGSLHLQDVLAPKDRMCTATGNREGSN